MRLASFVLSATLALALVCATSARARAQTIDKISGNVYRVLPGGTGPADPQYPHDPAVPINAISASDCNADLAYAFTLAISGPTTGTKLVGWAGTTDCTAYANRSGSSPACWPVIPSVLAPAGATTSFLVRMQDLARAAFTAPSSASLAYTSAGIDACTKQTADASATFTIYFFFVDANGFALNNAQGYPITVDTRAQSLANSDLALCPGTAGCAPTDSALTITLDVTADPDTAYWQVYCDPPPGLEAPVNTVPYDSGSQNGVCVDSGGDTGPSDASEIDASGDTGATEGGGVDGATGDDAGGGAADAAEDAPTSDAGDSGVLLVDAGGSVCGAPQNDAGIPNPGGACLPSAVLVSGGASTSTATTPVVVDAGADAATDAGTTSVTTTTGGTQPTQAIPDKYKCGTMTSTATSITVTGMKDGYYYNVAVAAVDAVGNVGPLAVSCGSPVVAPDFYGAYYGAGGRAGGGYCATEGVGVPSGTTGLAVLTVASALAMVRRRGQRRKAPRAPGRRRRSL
jgi:hypothetical protein